MWFPLNWRLAAGILVWSGFFGGGGGKLPAAPLDDLERLRPTTPEQVRAVSLAAWQQAARQLDEWFAARAWHEPAEPDDVLRRLGELVDAKARHDRLLEALLELRGQFAAWPDAAEARLAVRHYLRLLATAVDSGGRLRYTLRDAIDNASYALDPTLPRFEQMIRLLTERKVGVAANVLSYVLFDPAPDSGPQPYPESTKRLVLALCEAAEDPDLVPVLALYLREPDVAPGLALEAARVLVALGLPQTPLPNTAEEDLPALTPEEFQARLSAIEPTGLSAAEQARRRELLAWCESRLRHGVREPELRVGSCAVRPGDWLLMRNPSPYNRFTDLSPGLFTHAGVVAEQQDAAGRRHLVIVDLPERGTRIPATNVEVFLNRSLHYVFVRHAEPAVAEALAEAAASLIGNESQFDLAFQTSRIEALRGQELRGQRIHTYCAGLLLLLVQDAERPRTEFFPFDEFAASPRSLSNLSVIGLSLGDRFVSPTGPMFSPNLRLVGRREPMYDPGREVKEAVYDHFAQAISERPLVLAPDFLQTMRLESARLSVTYPWLGRALARLNDVSPEMDLEAAAKAASVIEGLDQIADRGWQQFEAAREAILLDESVLQPGPQVDADWLRQQLEFRRTHAGLLTQWTQGSITPRELRIALVAFYREQACRELEQKFFRAAP